MINPSLNGDHPMSNIRPLAQEMMMRPWISLAPTDLSFTNWKLNFRTQVIQNVVHNIFWNANLSIFLNRNLD